MYSTYIFANDLRTRERMKKLASFQKKLSVRGRVSLIVGYFLFVITEQQSGHNQQKTVFFKIIASCTAENEYTLLL